MIGETVRIDFSRVFWLNVKRNFAQTDRRSNEWFIMTYLVRGGAIRWNRHLNLTWANVRKFTVSVKEWARKTAVRCWLLVA